MKKTIAKRVIRIVVIVLIVGLVGTGVYFYMNFQNQMNYLTNLPMYRTSAVTNGDVLVGVTATGSITPQETVDVVIDWTGKVQEVFVERGDLIAEGDLIGSVVNESLGSDIASANNSLRQQEISLEKQKSNLTKTITAPEAGRIKDLKAMLGEDLSSTASAFGQVCWISPDSTMTMTFTAPYQYEKDDTFEVETKSGIRIRSTVTVSGDNKQITLDIHDDHMLEIGEEVTVFKPGENEILGRGTVSLKNGIKVTGSGKVTEILVNENDIVARGQELFRLDTSEAELSFESQTISVSDAQRKISDLRKDVGKSDIPAPISGVISALNLTKNTNCNTGTTVATIQSVDRLETVVNVDELDIAKISVGQKAEITLEALEGEVFTGTVTKIAVVGDNANGFATFPVTIAIDNPDRIKIGMSCEVTIEVDSAKEVVVLPVEAMSQDARGYYVQKITSYDPESAGEQYQNGLQNILTANGISLGNGGGSAPESGADEGIPVDGLPEGMQLPEGAEPPSDSMQGRPSGDGSFSINGSPMGGNQSPSNIPGLTAGRTVSSDAVTIEIVRVEVGLINENYAQILSGIEAGDIIAYSDSSGNSFLNMMMGGMGGGMSTTGSSVVVMDSGGPPRQSGGGR